MPANIITIDGVPEFYIEDTRVRDFLEWLRDSGRPQDEEVEKLLKEIERILSKGVQR